jgi:hypothetical protein
MSSIMMHEKKRSWGSIPSLDGLSMDWEYKSEAASNKRTSVRMNMNSLAKLFEVREIQVKVLVEELTYSGRLLDLSAGGLSLSLPISLASNLPIKLGFFLGQMKVISKAEVRHVRESEGRFITGVRFVDLEPKTAEFIRDLYASEVLRHAL